MSPSSPWGSLAAVLALHVCAGAEPAFIRLSSSAGNFTGESCAYDRLTATWGVAWAPEDDLDRIDSSALWAGLYEAGGGGFEPLHRWDGARKLGALAFLAGEDDSGDEGGLGSSDCDAPYARQPVIHCDVGGPSCAVHVQAVGWDADASRIEVS